MDPLYDIYSTGELVGDANPADTRAALAKLFKTTEDKIAHLMAGKPQLIKRQVEKADALRYKATLHQAGLMVTVKLSEEAAQSTTPSAAVNTFRTATAPTTSSPAATTDSADNSGFTLAPAGSNLLQVGEKNTFTPREIDTSAIKLAPTVFVTESVKTEAIQIPDTSHLILAEVGSILGSETEQPPLPAPDVSHLSVAEVGASLDEIKSTAVPLNPDISGLSLAETGVDLIPENYQKPAPPPAPSTDHIQLQPD